MKHIAIVFLCLCFVIACGRSESERVRLPEQKQVPKKKEVKKKVPLKEKIPSIRPSGDFLYGFDVPVGVKLFQQKPGVVVMGGDYSMKALREYYSKFTNKYLVKETKNGFKVMLTGNAKQTLTKLGRYQGPTLYVTGANTSNKRFTFYDDPTGGIFDSPSEVDDGSITSTKDNLYDVEATPDKGSKTHTTPQGGNYSKTNKTDDSITSKVSIKSNTTSNKKKYSSSKTSTSRAPDHSPMNVKNYSSRVQKLIKKWRHKTGKTVYLD